MDSSRTEDIVGKSTHASSMNANPVTLSIEELKEVYLRSL
jgi:alcohol dehydrogenase class IV